MKLTSVFTIALIGVSMTLVSCKKGNSEPQNPQNKVVAKTSEPNSSNLKVAYVDMDSLQKYSEYFKEVQATFDAKTTQYDNELKQLEQKYANDLKALQQDFQKSVESYQIKCQNGTINSQQAVDAEEKKIAQKQNNLISKEAEYKSNLVNKELQLKQSLQEEQIKAMEVFQKDLNDLIAEYNKDKNYDLILTKAGSSILYAHPSMDITKDVIDKLNKKHKK
jgi:outer membrane protein